MNLRIGRSAWLGLAAAAFGMLLGLLVSAPARATDYPLGKVIDIVAFKVKKGDRMVLPLNLNPKEYPNKRNHADAKAADHSASLQVMNNMEQTLLSQCVYCELLVFSDCPERLIPGYFGSDHGIVLYETRVPVLQSQGQTRFRLVLNHELDWSMSPVVFYVIFQNKVPGGKIDVYQARKGWARLVDDPVGAGKQTAFQLMTANWSPQLLVTLDEVGGTVNNKAFRLGGADTNHPDGEVKAHELLSGTYDYVAVFNPFQGSPPNGSLLVKVVAVKLTSPLTDPLGYLLTPKLIWYGVPVWIDENEDGNHHVRGTFRHYRRDVSAATAAPTPTEPWYYNFGRSPSASPGPFDNEYESSTDSVSKILIGNYGVSHSVSFTVGVDDPLLFVISARAGAVAAAPTFAGHGVFWQPGDYQRCYWEGPQIGHCEDLRGKEVSNIKALQYDADGPEPEYREGMVVGKVPSGSQGRVVTMDFTPVNGITTPIQLTVVNMAGEAQSEAGSGALEGQVVLFDTHGQILPTQQRSFTFQVRPESLLSGGGATMPLTFDLSWPGSDMKLSLVDPNGQPIHDGSLPPGVTRTKTGANEQFVVENPAAGQWTMVVDAVDVPTAGEPFSLAMAVPETPQANCTLTLTPPSASVDPLGTLQLNASGGTPPYTWMVTANNSGSSVNASGLFTAGSNVGLTDTVTVFDGGGCLPAATSILVAQAPAYPPGDVNGDGAVNVSDVFHLINYLFAGGAAPVGPADANGSGGVDVADVFYLINYLFAGGTPPLG